jgi:hypothetical protein
MAEVAALCRGTKSEVEGLTKEVIPRLTRLEIRVFGSKPPPVPPNKSAAPGELEIAYKPSTPPLVERIKTSENATELLAQEVSNLRGELKEVRDINAQQSKTLGIAPAHGSRLTKTRAYMGSRAAIKDLLALVTAIGVVLSLWRGMSVPPPLAPAPLPSGVHP